MPSLYLNTYAPLVATAAGRQASESLGLAPFIDGSIRREPDLEHARPSISCLCRGAMFAPRLKSGDVVIYLTKKARYRRDERHWRMTAVLKVARLFDSHPEAAAWYVDEGLAVPSNCMVDGNPPNPLSHSHRSNQHKHLTEDKFLRRWDAGYRHRSRTNGRFVVCDRLRVDLSWTAAIVHEEHLQSVFGKVPATRNPGAHAITRLRPLLAQLGVDAPPSCP